MSSTASRFQVSPDDQQAAIKARAAAIAAREEAAAATPVMNPDQPLVDAKTGRPVGGPGEGEPGQSVDNVDQTDAAPASETPAETLKEPEDESAAQEGLADPHPHPTPVPLAFVLFLEMARQLNIPEARDALGNDMLTTAFEALPPETQALFRVPDEKTIATERAGLILKNYRPSSPATGPATMGGALAGLLRDVGRSLPKAFRKLSSLTPDDMSLKRSQWILQSQKKAESSLAQLEQSVQALRDHPQHGDFFRRVNAQFQDGVARQQPLQCNQAQDNLYEEARRPGNEDLYKELLKVNRSFVRYQRHLKATIRNGGLTDDQGQDHKQRLTKVAAVAGVAEMGNGQTLHDRVNDLMTRLMKAIETLFQRVTHGPTPGPM